MNNAGDIFQQATKYTRGAMPAGGLDWASQPELYKVYPNATKTPLPKVSAPDAGTLHDALIRRKSERRFAPSPLTAEQLSYLLWAATGISHRQGGYDMRTAPSAGALYPIETYVAIRSVSAIDPGIYHYAIADHALELLTPGDHSAAVARAALDQEMCVRAAAVFIWTAVFQRSKWKYGQRAYRYVYLDAGHIAQNLALAAAGLNLAACHIAALYDDEANALLNIDGTQESTIYMTAIGQH
ncbi:MAG: SagB/ThcOx family dehydrogenase [Phycisphaerae bacterium]|nr:SagB/ThcOx family dehydrogenase [Phycisphaerae bacterium]